MTTPEEQPTVGDFLARLEFKYDNDVLDFLKTGKGVVVVEDKVANIPLPQGEKGDKGDIGQLREGDVRYFNHRTDEAEAAAEASEASAGNAKASEEAAKTSETNAKASEAKAKASETKAKASETKAKTSETNAKSSETKAKASETNAKTSEANAKASEGESTSQAELSTEAAAISALSALAFDQLVGEGLPEGKVEAPVGSIYTDRLATNGAIRWIKTSGTGNTGWKVEYGDTGWRDIGATGDVTWDFSGHVRYGIAIRRTGERVTLWMAGAYDESTGHNLFQVPEGFRHQVGRYGLTFSNVGMARVERNLYAVGAYANARDYYISESHPSSGRAFGEFTWTTDEPWPTTLPGTPA